MFQELSKTTFSVVATGGEKNKSAWVLHHVSNGNDTGQNGKPTLIQNDDFNSSPLAGTFQGIVFPTRFLE